MTAPARSGVVVFCVATDDLGRLDAFLADRLAISRTQAVLDGDLDQFIQPYLLGVRRADRPADD